MDRAGLPNTLATELVSLPVPGTALRVAVDGPQVAEPGAFADALVVPLRALGRPATHIRAEMFWRDAALRLEYGRTDVKSFVNGWLDIEALRREVLDPLGPGGSGRFLPSLRHPGSNRATREPARSAEPGSIVLISGELLLRHGLPFDRTIHLAVSPAARRRRTPAQWQWTLPAFDDYDVAVDPVRHSDVALRFDDPGRPAIRLDPPAA
ncbi:MAG: uridine kinase [Actinomycetota bacterium]|nr:uridine kinase [Actinomycetota bacterium]